MTLTVTRYGNTTDGGSNQDPAADTLYTIPITVLTAGWAVAVELYGQGGILMPTSVLMANNAGVPGQIIALFPRSSVNPTISSTVRRMVTPSGVWVTAQAYWVGVQSPAGVGSGQFRWVTGASGVGFNADGNSASVVTEPGTTGATAPSATTRAFSIQLVVIGTSENGGGGGGGGGGGSTGSNRMGGTGAIRKPPRLIR